MSANVIKAAEDKTHIGAFVASPTDPWGQSVPAATTHAGWTYREVFARDSYETFTGLLADGDTASARDMTRFLFDHAQQPDGSFPRDSELNGAVAPDTFGLSEIDEVAYPLLMAWQAGLAGKASFYGTTSARRRTTSSITARSRAPSAGRSIPGSRRRRSPSEIAGLVAAGKLATAAGDTARADLYFATADDYQRNVKRWTVTTTGPDGPRYFIRESSVRQPQHSTDLRPRERQPQACRSALDHRRRLPGADTDGRALRARSRRPGVAARRRLRAEEPDRVWPRLAPLRDQGPRRHRRLRRLLRAGSDQLLARPASRGSRTRSALVTCGRC